MLFSVVGGLTATVTRPPWNPAPRAGAGGRPRGAWERAKEFSVFMRREIDEYLAASS